MILTVFTGILTLHFNSCKAQSKSEKIDALVAKYAEYGQFNGSVLVVEKGEILYKKAFGMADMDAKIPNDPDTKFRLASVTKQFTAMLIIQLAAENKVKLDIPISNYLPSYPKKTGEIITLHHLLTHTSGIPNYTSALEYRDVMQKSFKPEQLVDLFDDLPLEFKPGEKFQYSNSGYVLLGYIIEKITGQTFEENLKKKICLPLKMHNTGVEHNDIKLKNTAKGYNRGGSTFQEASYIDMSVPFSAGAMYSTLEDLYLWDRALYTEKLVPKKYLDLIFETHIPSHGKVFYGYGWQIGKMFAGNSEDIIPVIYHTGAINGFNTIITRIPEEKSLIVFLNNTADAPLMDMTIAINGILYDKPYDLPKRSVALTTYDAIQKDGISFATLLFKKIKGDANYYLDEQEINGIGYDLMAAGKNKEAAAIFKLNIEAFPNSFNTYDSYGESLRALKDTTGAIENYTRSVKMNPGNEGGLKALKELGANTENLIWKASLEDMKKLEGKFRAITDVKWIIEFKLKNGVLTGYDRGYNFNLTPVSKNNFINPADGAKLAFNTDNSEEISLMLFDIKFKKED